jgi:hypothetical protein
MSNVVAMFNRTSNKPGPQIVPQSIEGPIEAIIDWAQSNGIDVQNNVAFQFRLADFMALLRTEITKEKMTA